jgi:predicted RNA-binding Zn ribbon-like protein
MLFNGKIFRSTCQLDFDGKITPMTARKFEQLELIGNVICLDFVNTINDQFAPKDEYLENYSDVLDWSQHASIISKRQTRALHQLLASHTKEATQAFKRALQLRALFYRVFSSLSSGQDVEQADLDNVVAAYAKACVAARLQPNPVGFRWTWDFVTDLEAPLHAVAHTAGELLTSGNFKRIKSCPACGWLFLDTSKNGSRRWCSMETCGSRDKMKRFYQRTRLRG